MFKSLVLLTVTIMICSTEPLVDYHFDWRENGAILPVMISNCVQSSIINALDAISALYQIQGNQLIQLSRQQIYDCGSSEWCPNGKAGNVSEIYRLIFNQGLNNQIDSEFSYPYTEDCDKVCKFNKTGAAVSLNGFTYDYDDYIDEDFLYNMIEKAPVVVEVNGGVASFLDYSGGVYDNEECTSDVKDHTLLLVGFGTENGIKYWIARNTWGTEWGENGYIRIVRDKNMCGIGSGFAQPILVS